MKTCCTLFIIIALWLLPSGMEAREKVWQQVTVGHANRQEYGVSQVVVNDTATLLTMVATALPDTPLMLRRCSHLRDDKGRLYALRTWRGMEMGQTVWMDETGRREFVLAFDPLPDDVRWVDFVESEVHRDRLLLLGIAENGKANASRFRQRTLRQMFDCTRSFGAEKAVLQGRLKGFQPKSGHASLFLCHEAALADGGVHALAACHIQPDGSFTLAVPLKQAALLVLTSEEEGDAWRIPVFLHPADRASVVVDFDEGRVVDYHSRCSVRHLSAMQDVAAMGADLCQPAAWVPSATLTATYDSPATKGKRIIETMAKKYTGKYVEFVGMSAKTMVSTLSQLSNIRYDFHNHPDIQFVYLFDGKSVTRSYYEKFVARYLEEEDAHLLSADDFAAVREFLLSRESSVVGTLNRDGFPLVNPLNYSDEFEFRRRFRLILHAESELLTKDEQVMIDTMVEVPDTLALIYDREQTYGAGSPLIPQHQAQAEHRLLGVMWWVVAILLLLGVGAALVIVRNRKAHPEADAESPLEEPEPKMEPTKATGDGFWENMVAAWAAKRPKNARLLADLEKECPLLTKREQAMCLIFYSENLPDDKAMEILEMPSPSAYRTAKSRLRKKLKDVELPEIKKLCL